MELHFAPLQGYTDRIYRSEFNKLFGGIDVYYTPFMRLEKDGNVRRKDLRDIEPDESLKTRIVPQILPGNGEEMRSLLEEVQARGYVRADLNLGCPFPMVVRSGRGSGLLTRMDMVEELLKSAREFSNVRLSVKLRLGIETPNDAIALLPLFQKYNLEHIAVHARTTVQQYKGAPDMESFEEIYKCGGLPLIYNGDVTDVEGIDSIQNRFPDLKGIMVGRGFLQDPFLAAECKGVKLSDAEKRARIMTFHEALFDAYSQRLSGEAHVILKMKTLWDYLLPNMGKKERKIIKKAKICAKYLAAVRIAIETSEF